MDAVVAESKLNRNPSRRGFTIVELIIVIVVIGILAAITVVAYNGVQQRARDTVRKDDISTIGKQLAIYEYDNGPMYTGSGCGNSGNGNGWFNVQNGSSYPISMMNCLINAGVTSTTIVDPSGSVSCSGLSCRAYMKYSCIQSGKTATYVYANLESGTHDGTETDGTCAGGIDTSYGMNYYLKVEL